MAVQRYYAGESIPTSQGDYVSYSDYQLLMEAYKAASEFIDYGVDPDHERGTGNGYDEYEETKEKLKKAWLIK